MEAGTLKLRHILTYLRLLYHHHILTRDANESINKIYQKEKQDNVKGDWFRLLMKDFDFIGIEMNEAEIKAIPKYQYKKRVQDLVRKAAFNYFVSLKETDSSKRNFQYSGFSLQTSCKQFVH